jgi:hypothetical protein
VAQDSTSTSEAGGSQRPHVPTNNNPPVNIYMMNTDAHLLTRTHDYETSKFVKKGKDSTNPLNPLQIQKAVGETMTRIPKGAFKKASHNKNMRSA